MLPRTVTAEIRRRVRELYREHSYSEMAQILSAELGVPISEGKIGFYMHSIGLRRDTQVFLPQEVRDYILASYRGVGPTEMTERVCSLFGIEYDVERMKGFYGRHHLNSGLTGRFENWHVPFNKGWKGWVAPGTERTRFQKGNRPTDWRPVGSERIDSKDGYVFVKIAEPNVWALKHRVVYEAHFGPIPKGMVVIFRDQNKRNCAPENLMLVSRGELATLNHQVKLCDSPEINDTKLLLTRVISTAHRRSKG